MKTIKLLLLAVGIVSVGTLNAQVLKANVNKSEISWLGKKVGGEHSGTIALKSGVLNVEENVLIGGEFVIDMNSIKNTDIENAEFNQKLVGHLKSDDFFGVESYPEAKLVISEKAPINGNTAKIKGNLTIKGTTNPVVFDMKKEGNTYLATIKVDRAKYNVRYGSGSFFDNLGDKVIDDNFELGVKLVVE